MFWYVLSRDGSIIRNEFLEIHENSLKLLFETHFSCHWSEQPWLSLWMRKWWNSIAKSKTKKLPYLFHFRRGIKFFKKYKLDCVSWIKKFARNCILNTDFFKSLRSTVAFVFNSAVSCTSSASWKAKTIIFYATLFQLKFR